jgi:hypothetical protein
MLGLNERFVCRDEAGEADAVKEVKGGNGMHSSRCLLRGVSRLSPECLTVYECRFIVSLTRTLVFVIIS